MKSRSANDRFPRTLYVWLSSEDKALKQGITDGMTVAAIAEKIQREPVSIIRHLNDIGIFEFKPFSEEWVEIMSLGLAGVPLDTAIDWCTAADARLPIEMIDAMVEHSLRDELELAREHRLILANEDAIGDLIWLQDQPSDVRAGYSLTCEKLIDAFEVLTPTTLKAAVLNNGCPAPGFILSAPAYKPASRARRRGTRTYSRTKTIRAGSSYASKKFRRARKSSMAKG